MSRNTSTDAVQAYLDRIGPMATLSPADEVMLAKRIEVGVLAEARLRAMSKAGGDDAADLRCLASSGRDAYRRFMEGNLKLVVSVAKRYTGRGLALIDLIQNGNVGLDRAVKQFDYTRGTRFSTSAVWWIRQPIWQSLADEARVVRVPVHTMEAIERVRRMDGQLTSDLGRDPTSEELARGLLMEPSDVRRLIAVDRRPLSLDTAHVEGDAARTIGEQLLDGDDVSTAEIVESAAVHEAVRECVRWLPRRQRDVVIMRFGLDGRAPMTLARIGSALGVSKQRVRQIELLALERLRTGGLAAQQDAPQAAAA